MTVGERVRVQVSIGSRVRWVSHLEFLRVMMRCIRRAELPVRYSQGFNPHPQVSFAAARPVGLSSDAEFADILLDEDVNHCCLRDALDRAFPPGFSAVRACPVEPARPSLTAAINASRYRYLVHGDEPDAWRQAVDAFCSAEEFSVLRKRRKKPDRQVDIRPHVYEIDVACGSGSIEIRADMALGGQDNVRPQEFWHALVEGLPGGMDPADSAADVGMHRLAMYRRERERKVLPWDL